MCLRVMGIGFWVRVWGVRLWLGLGCAICGPCDPCMDFLTSVCGPYVAYMAWTLAGWQYVLLIRFTIDVTRLVCLRRVFLVWLVRLWLMECWRLQFIAGFARQIWKGLYGMTNSCACELLCRRAEVLCWQTWATWCRGRNHVIFSYCTPWKHNSFW